MEGEIGRKCGTHWGRAEIATHTGFWWENLKEIYHLEELEVDGRITLKLILKECNERMWTEFIWLRVGSSDGLL
jgi:hypothetical protein